MKGYPLLFYSQIKMECIFQILKLAHLNKRACLSVQCIVEEHRGKKDSEKMSALLVFLFLVIGHMFQETNTSAANTS